MVGLMNACSWSYVLGGAVDARGLTEPCSALMCRLPAMNHRSGRSGKILIL